MNKSKMVKLCTTKYTNYHNNYDNCIREELEGCEGCRYYVNQIILKLFEKYEREGFAKDEIDEDLFVKL